MRARACTAASRVRVCFPGEYARLVIRELKARAQSIRSKGGREVTHLHTRGSVVRGHPLFNSSSCPSSLAFSLVFHNGRVDGDGCGRCYNEVSPSNAVGVVVSHESGGCEVIRLQGHCPDLRSSQLSIAILSRAGLRTAFFLRQRKLRWG